MILIKPYNRQHKEEWDFLIRGSGTGTFMLQRGFVEYHKERFEDYSLTAWQNDELLAVLPASVSEKTIHSHQGLSYGGIVFRKGIGTQTAASIFFHFLQFFKKNGFEKLVYKQIPFYYYSSPNHLDQYPLFCVGAKLFFREMSQVVDLDKPLKMQSRRKRGVKHAKKLGMECQESSDWEGFWKMLSANLAERYGKLPVHSLKEIGLLKSLFPENIRLFTVQLKDETLGGTVIYINHKTIHAQYIASNPLGKKYHALDFLFFSLLEKFKDFEYFSFGVSNTRNGVEIDKGLFEWKESWGAIPWSHDIYEIDLASLTEHIKTSEEIFTSINK